MSVHAEAHKLKAHEVKFYVTANQIERSMFTSPADPTENHQLRLLQTQHPEAGNLHLNVVYIYIYVT